MNIFTLPPVLNDVAAGAPPIAPAGGDGAEFEQVLDRALRDETRPGTDRNVHDRVSSEDGNTDEVAADEGATDETSPDQDAIDETSSDGTSADETSADETSADETSADEERPAADAAASAEPTVLAVVPPTTGEHTGTDASTGTEDPMVVALEPTDPTDTGQVDTGQVDTGSTEAGSTDQPTTTPEPVDPSTAGGVDTATDQPTDQPTDQRVGRSADASIDPVPTEAPAAPLSRPGSTAAGDPAAAGTDAAERLLRMNELVDAARATLRHRGTERLVLELHPAELGTVTVDLRLDGQAVNVALRAAHPGAVERLLGELAALRSDLAEAGIDVGDLDVHSGSQGRSGERDRTDGPGGTDPRRTSALGASEAAADRAAVRARHLGDPITTNGRLAVDL